MALDGSGDFQFPTEEHPVSSMVNFVILRTLFDFASFEDLKVFRQVNKLWWETSLRRWRREFWIPLTDGSEDPRSVGGYLNFMEESRGAPDQSKLDVYPFKKYRIRSWRIDPMPQEIHLTFWTTFGPSISHLEMANCWFDVVQDFRSILFERVPNLEVFIYNLNRVVRRLPYSWNGELVAGGANHKLREFRYVLDQHLDTELPSLTDFFCHFPKITNLVLSHTEMGKAYARHDFQHLMEALQSLADAHEIKIHLHNLNLLGERNFAVTEGHLRILHQLQLPLTSLSLRLYSQVDATLVQKVIELHCSTLRKLFLVQALEYGRPDSVQNSLFKVTFNNLEELGIDGGSISKSLQFLKFTPSLKKLLIVNTLGHGPANMLRDFGSFLPFGEELKFLFNNFYFIRESDEDLIGNTNFAEMSPCSSLSEFVYVSCRSQWICSPLQVEALARIMPNLRRLHLGVTSEGFHRVCQKWSELEVLLVSPWMVDSSPINIPSLKNLRYFGMNRGSFWYPGYELRDESVIQGILRCKRLEKITVICSTEMTDETFNLLRLRFPSSRVTRGVSGSNF